MKLIECLFTQSACYKAKQSMKPTGIVVHSTGCNNPNLKRYVQPSVDDKNYLSLFKTIGKNANANDWNKPNAQVCVHYFIGKLADGSIATAHALPDNIACWGCGRGTKGSFNYNPTGKIQFEVLEDDLTNEKYFKEVYVEAVELCAFLCKKYGFGVDKITSHKEAHALGYASNHGDIDHWLKKFGKTMDDFRKDVQALLSNTTSSSGSNTGTIYRVQVGAFKNKANAEAMVKKLKAAGFDAIITTK